MLFVANTKLKVIISIPMLEAICLAEITYIMIRVDLDGRFFFKLEFKDCFLFLSYNTEKIRC